MKLGAQPWGCCTSTPSSSPSRWWTRGPSGSSSPGPTLCVLVLPTPMPRWRQSTREPWLGYSQRGKLMPWLLARPAWALRISPRRTRGWGWRTITTSMMGCGKWKLSNESCDNFLIFYLLIMKVLPSRLVAIQLKRNLSNNPNINLVVLPQLCNRSWALIAVSS